MSVTPLLALVLLLAGTTTSRRVFETLYEWNFINFDLPYGSFVPENNLFTGLEIYWDRIFLALPNLKSGVPASLTWLPRPDQPGAAFVGQSPALQVSHSVKEGDLQEGAKLSMSNHCNNLIQKRRRGMTQVAILHLHIDNNDRTQIQELPVSMQLLDLGSSLVLSTRDVL